MIVENAPQATAAPDTDARGYFVTLAERAIADRGLTDSVDNNARQHREEHRKWLLEHVYRFQETHSVEWKGMRAALEAAGSTDLSDDDLNLRVGEIISVGDWDAESGRRAVKSALSAASAIREFTQEFAKARVDGKALEMFYGEIASLRGSRLARIDTRAFLGHLSVLPEVLEISALATRFAIGGLQMKSPKGRPPIGLVLPVKCLMDLWLKVTGQAVPFAKGTQNAKRTRVDPATLKPQKVRYEKGEPRQPAARFVFHAMRVAYPDLGAASVITSINLARKLPNGPYLTMNEAWLDTLAQFVGS